MTPLTLSTWFEWHFTFVRSVYLCACLMRDIFIQFSSDWSMMEKEKYSAHIFFLTSHKPSFQKTVSHQNVCILALNYSGTFLDNYNKEFFGVVHN